MQSDDAVKRLYALPWNLFCKTHTSFLSEKRFNRQIDTKVLVLYIFPLSGMFTTIEKNTQMKTKRIIPNT